MATKWWIDLHINKGKSVAWFLQARTDYIQNSEKTSNSWISASPGTMMLSL